MTNAERHTIARERYEERAAILQFDGGLSRGEAERQAAQEVMEWLKANPENAE